MATIKGKALQTSASIEQKYHKELDILTRRMVLTTQREIERLFSSSLAGDVFAQDASLSSQARILLNRLSVRFNRAFSDKASELIGRMLSRASRESKVQLGASLKQISGGLTIKVADMPADLKEQLTAITNANVDLIKSIPEQYLFKVKQSVMHSITSADGGLKSLIPQLESISGHTYKRVKQIALDQTRKAYQGMNIERAKAAGVKKGIWVHTGGSKEPRSKHVKFNGQVFELAKGAPIGENGEYVMPSEEYYCRCTFIPILDFGEE